MYLVHPDLTAEAMAAPPARFPASYRGRVIDLGMAGMTVWPPSAAAVPPVLSKLPPTVSRVWGLPDGLDVALVEEPTHDVDAETQSRLYARTDGDSTWSERWVDDRHPVVGCIDVEHSPVVAQSLPGAVRLARLDDGTAITDLALGTDVETYFVDGSADSLVVAAQGADFWRCSRMSSALGLETVAEGPGAVVDVASTSGAVFVASAAIVSDHRDGVVSSGSQLAAEGA